MAYYQQLIFDWVATQPALTGVVIAAAGLLFGLYGFRMVRFLVGLSLAVAGYGGGMLACSVLGLPEVAVAPALALVGGAFGLFLPGPATILASGVTWAFLGAYFSTQVGMHESAAVIGACLLGCGGGALAILNRHTMVALMTSFQGAALFIVGFVGLAQATMPGVGVTFRQWAHNQSLVVPVLLLMLVLTGYTCQVNARQGNLRIGSADEDRRRSQQLPKQGQAKV